MLGSTFTADLREDEAGYENALALLQDAGHVFESVSEQAECELEDRWGLVFGSLVRREGAQPLVQSNEGLWHGGRARAASCRWGDRGEGLCFTVPSLPLGLLMRRGVGTEIVVFAEHRHLGAGRWVGVSGLASPARALPLRAPMGRGGVGRGLRCSAAMRKGAQPLVQSNEGLWHGRAGTSSFVQVGRSG